MKQNREVDMNNKTMQPKIITTVLKGKVTEYRVGEDGIKYMVDNRPTTDAVDIIFNDHRRLEVFTAIIAQIEFAMMDSQEIPFPLSPV